MAWLDALKTFINNLEEKQFYLYVSSFIGTVFLIIVFGIVLFYRNVSFYKKQLSLLNEQRTEIQTILQKNFRVEQQRTKVNQLLSENESFKIGGFLKDELAKIQLTNSLEGSRPLQADTGSTEYSESILEARLISITMQQLCTLLNDISTNKRVYIKVIDMSISKRTPRTIDVTLTIATLERIAETPSEVTE